MRVAAIVTAYCVWLAVAVLLTLWSDARIDRRLLLMEVRRTLAHPPE